jgi:alpha-mannosidase/mannosylglycerate hydrolase
MGCNSLPERALIMAKRRAHYVVSTHWDREWYQTFQDYRYRLVALLDHVLDGLLDGRLQGPFYCDGQAIVLDDYLEVRPERRAQVQQLLRERRLVAGPWFVMPDAFLVSGESLIRNLRLGRQLVRSLGGTPSSAGFVCDLFGFNSQVPQLFAGFGIRFAFLWRGVPASGRRLFRWQGADGSEVPVYRFGRRGYCTFCDEVRSAFDQDVAVSPAEVPARVQAHLEREAALNEVGPILLFDGGDHQEWDEPVYQALFAAAKDKAFPGYEVVHTDLDTYLAEMLPHAGRIRTVLTGELREPAQAPLREDEMWVIPGVLSSRVWIKQENARIETLLCHWAEPFSAFAEGLDQLPDPAGYLDTAWRWLLTNHPHDSMCGCSIDAVHRDMQYRFRQASQIGERVTTDALQRLTAAIEGTLEGDCLRLSVFNPLPQPFSGVAELTVPVPAGWPLLNEFFGFEGKPAFHLYGPDGEELPYQRLAQQRGALQPEITVARFPRPRVTDPVRIAVQLAVPAMGYTTLTVKPIVADTYARHYAPNQPGLATSERSLANEHLAVTIEPNGTLTLDDLATGQRYSRLLTFEDCADIGDGWYHGPVVNDQTFVSTAATSDVALLYHGPLAAAFRLRTTLRLPREFDFKAMARGQEFTELTLETDLVLRAGQRYLDLTTRVRNTVCDHRLRVLLPSGAQAETYLADSAFDVIERPIALRADNATYRELEVETKPQRSWTAVHDAQRGLAVLAEGLLETAVRDLPERPLALTLYRSTRRTVFTTGEPEGQLLTDLAFRWRVMPLAGAPDPVALGTCAQELAAGLRSATVTPIEQRRLGGAAGRPLTHSFCQLTGPALLTSLTRREDALEARLYNPTRHAVTVTLRGALPGAPKWPCRATPVDFESQAIGKPLPSRAGQVKVALQPKQICTLRLE